MLSFFLQEMMSTKSIAPVSLSLQMSFPSKQTGIFDDFEQAGRVLFEHTTVLLISHLRITFLIGVNIL